MSTVSFNIVIGDHFTKFKNNFPTDRIVFQTEHTLVRLGGRDAQDASIGNTNVEGTAESYLVILCDYSKISQADIVIDYSRANIKNIKDSNLYSMNRPGCSRYFLAS